MVVMCVITRNEILDRSKRIVPIFKIMNPSGSTYELPFHVSILLNSCKGCSH